MQEMQKSFSETISNDIITQREEVYDKNFTYYSVKRMIDIVGSIVGLIILSPVFMIIAILIKVDSKGPVFYSQDRVGQNGKLFKMFKFRSMIVNADELLEMLSDKNEMTGPMFKIKDDPRITRFGRFIRKTSIDELPQIYNILRGEMSLVGPRPNLPNEVDKFNEYQRKKLLARPGLTCYWQIMGRSSLGFDDWIRLDLKYIEDRNTFLDLLLILKTFKVFLGDKNAQ